MKYLLLSICMLTYTSIFAKERVDVYIQANPYLNINAYKTSGIGKTHMPATHLKMGTGIEVDIPINPQIHIIPFGKWYGQKVKVEQTDMMGLFNPGSKSYRSQGYGNINLGMLFQHTLKSGYKATWHVLGGASYSYIYHIENSAGYTLTSNSNGPIEFGLYTGDDNNFDMRKHVVNLAIGSRVQAHMLRIGDFKFGCLVFVPLSKMPSLTYKSQIVKGSNVYETNTTSSTRQLNVELSIMYNLFGFRV